MLTESYLGYQNPQEPNLKIPGNVQGTSTQDTGKKT